VPRSLPPRTGNYRP